MSHGGSEEYLPTEQSEETHANENKKIQSSTYCRKELRLWHLRAQGTL